MGRSWGFTTTQIHAGWRPDPAHDSAAATALPIYQTTAFKLGPAAEAAALFTGRRQGFAYTRSGNPTAFAVEQQLAALEGGVAAALFASGQAATAAALSTLASVGHRVVAASALYGGTTALLAQALPRLGIAVDFVRDSRDLDQWRAAIGPKTRALFAESISNPGGQVLDIAAVASLAHQAGLPLVVDNTLATPYATRPLEHGADVVVHSASKYLSGHGAVIAGAVIDGGAFDFAAQPDRWPEFNQPVDGWGDLVYTRDFGPDGELGAKGANLAFTSKLRIEQLHDLGASIAPFTAFLLGLGLQTLSLRMDRHLENAAAVAEHLAGHQAVRRVIYPGLESSPDRALALRYAPKGPGGIVAFAPVGGEPAAKALVDALKLFTHAANIGDLRSLAIHPASTTHAQVDPGELDRLGVTADLVRLSVGLEDIEDLLADLDQALAAAGPVV